MSARLHPNSPLTNVALVHDYLQLLFADEVLNIMNPVSQLTNGAATPEDPASVADSMRQLVGRRLVTAEFSSDPLLTLTFEGGSQLAVMAAPHRPTGTEAFVFMGRAEHVVEHNA